MANTSWHWSCLVGQAGDGCDHLVWLGCTVFHAVIDRKEGRVSQCPPFFSERFSATLVDLFCPQPSVAEVQRAAVMTAVYEWIHALHDVGSTHCCVAAGDVRAVAMAAGMSWLFSGL